MEARRRIITLHSKRYSVLEIRKRLQEENLSISRQSIHNLITKFKDHRTVADLPRRRRERKITTQMRSFVMKTRLSIATRGTSLELACNRDSRDWKKHFTRNVHACEYRELSSSTPGVHIARDEYRIFTVSSALANNSRVSS